MKNLKKLSGILLAIAVLLACTVSAFAESGSVDSNPPAKGSIKITNAIQTHKYTIYRILVLESYDTDKQAYSYRVSPAWSGFFADGAGIKDVYVNIDINGYVTWNDSADVAEFAKKALAYAKENGIANQGTKTASSSVLEFTTLDLGYYLVDSSIGALCSLNTTNPEAAIQEKNTAPTVQKLVKEDDSSDPDPYGTSNTAQIGSVVEFKTTITALKGAENYILHDDMDAGLTLDKNSIKVYKSSIEDGNKLSTEYTLSTKDVNTMEDGCEFEIKFTQDFLNTITGTTSIIVTYSATLNESALISGSVNSNSAWLTYGDATDKEKTATSTTSTTTYKFEIIKTDTSKALLTGAEFELYDAATGDGKIALVKVGDVYRVATNAEKDAPGFKSEVIKAVGGRATVVGLDNNTSYWLEETKQPDGYNKLASRAEAKIESTNKISNLAADATTWAEANGGVWIENAKGSLLPSTGGIGTTIFYIVGGVLVAAAVVLLVAKKRTSENR